MRQRVVWSEGMFMSPQHLQQLDLYHEAYVAARVGALAGASFGAVDLEIDTAALRSGEVVISRFAGLLPDGSPVAFDRQSSIGSAEVPAARSLAGHVSENRQTADVFVAVPVEREGNTNYFDEGAEESPGLARHRIVRRPVRDMADAGADPVEIAFAPRHLVILFGDEPREDYTSLKIAEVELLPNGEYGLVEDYVPPCLAVRASTFLSRGIERLHAALYAKYRALARERSLVDASTVELSGRDLTRFLQLSTIAGSLPGVRYLFDAEHVPPEVAYLKLSEIAGQLISFQGEHDPDALPVYRPSDLRETFRRLFDLISGMLSMSVRTDYVTIPLEPSDRGVMLGRLDETAAKAGTFLVAVKSQTVDAERLSKQLPRLSKIASPDEIAAMMTSAINGVRLAPTTRPPPQIPIQPDVVYFTLMTDSEDWRRVVDMRQIALYFPRPYDPGQTDIRLFAVP